MSQRRQPVRGEAAPRREPQARAAPMRRLRSSSGELGGLLRPPIVADGGMGGSSAVAALRCRGGEPPRGRERASSVHLGYIRAGAELIETNTFGANAAEARAALPRGRVRADQRRRGALAREAREVAGARRLHRRLDRPARRRRARGARARRSSTPSRRRSSRAAASTSSWSRRSTTSTSSRPRSARSARSRRCRSSRCMTFDGDGETLARRVGRRTRRRACAARRRRVRREPRRRAGGRARRARARWAATAAVLAALPNVGLASMSGQRIVFPHATPAYFGRVRRAGARARRARDRRLLRHDAGADRGDPRGGRRRPPARRLAARPRARRRRRRRRRPTEPTQLAAAARRRRVRRLGAARPAARREPGGAARRRRARSASPARRSSST